MWIWFVSVVASLLVIVLIIGCRGVDISRQVSREGIENEKVAQAYNCISRWPQFRFLRRMIVAEIRTYHPKGILVDAGCGPGYLVAAMAKSFPHLYIIGVDVAQEMVQLASRNMSSLGLGKRVEFRRGDVQQLPLEDDSVDFVVSTLSLHHWSEPKQALEEIFRTLKPGGQSLVFDLRRDARRLSYWLLRFAERFVVPAPLRNINEPTGSVRSSYTMAEAEALFSETPFQQHRTKPGFGWIFVSGRKG
jgi:ubiquinone/menaquinone biosynthesis C-methylase UbiE